MTVVVQDLIELAERCEKATEGDRELDLAIINAITTKTGWFWCDADRRTITRNDYGHGAIGNPICSLENFTGSIDAAMTLVPEGFASAVGTMGFKDQPRKPWACYWTPQGVPHSVEAATPALALCAASLRARASIKGEG